MFGEALAFPRNDDRWLRTVLVGGGLVLLGALFFLPILPVYGYLLRTVEAGAVGRERPPRFEDWEGLFLDGVKTFAVLFLFVTLPSTVLLILLFVVFGVWLIAVGSGGVTPAVLAVGAVVGLFCLAVLLVVLVTGYVFPAALVGLARDEEFSAAFDLGRLKRVAFDLAFLKAWLLVLAVGFLWSLALLFGAALFVLVGRAAGSLAAGLLLGGGVFVVASPFVGFYIQVVVFHLLGQGTGAALSLTDETERDGGDRRRDQWSTRSAGRET